MNTQKLILAETTDSTPGNIIPSWYTVHAQCFHSWWKQFVEVQGFKNVLQFFIFFETVSDFFVSITLQVIL